MKRKDFLRTSAGFMALAAVPGIWNIAIPKPQKKQTKFLRIQNDKFLAPVIKVTPNDGLYNHTYFDVTPFSPSQRYMAVTRIPYEDHMPVQGDLAEVIIIDLQEETVCSVYKTTCWGFQTGTNVQWGATDDHVYCNDVINGEAVAVRINIETGETKAFVGPMYNIAPDESNVISFPLELFDYTQLGYGCPPVKLGEYKQLPKGASKTEGIWKTNLKTNKKELIVSLFDAASVLPEKPPTDDYTYYFWHSKYNKQGTRIYQVLRCIMDGNQKKRNPVNVTFKPDGSEIFYTTPDYPVWGSGGGHPNWHPNGDYLIRHLDIEGTERFVMFKYDGSEFIVLSDKIEATGHPSIEPSGRYIITDDDFREGKNEFVFLRLIDLKAEKEEVVCTLPTVNWRELGDDNVFRLDGHPAWSRDYKKVSLQASHEGKRQLFVVDLSKLI